MTLFAVAETLPLSLALFFNISSSLTEGVVCSMSVVMFRTASTTVFIWSRTADGSPDLAILSSSSIEIWNLVT